MTDNTTRRLLHRRSVTCEGYERDDGLWDIEATLTDIKTYPIENSERGQVPAGEPIHDMTLCLTLDDSLRIHAVSARTRHAPYHDCAAPPARYDALVGLQIGSGWLSDARRRVARAEGCTHLSELLQYIGTAAIQTLFSVLEAKAQANPGGSHEMPDLRDSCYAFRRDGPQVLKRWPRRKPAQKTEAQNSI